MNSKGDSIDFIFQDLKDKGCITASDKIEESEDCDNFHAEHGIIYFNPKKINGWDVKSKRFCILHEEKHNRIPYRYIGFLIISCIPITLLLFISGLLLIIPFPLIVLFVAFKRLEEYDCDEFASIMLRDKLGELEQPSKILEKTLEKIECKNCISGIIHPTHEKRVRHIAKIVDKKIGDY